MPEANAQGSEPLRVVCVHEQVPVVVPEALAAHDGVPTAVDAVPVEALPAYLRSLGDRPLAAALIFSKRALTCPPAVRLLREQKRLDRTRLYLFLPGAQPWPGFREEADDVDDILDGDAITAGDVARVVRNGVQAYSALGANALPRFYLDATYSDVFAWFESSRWEWSEAPDLGGIRRELLTDDQIDLVKQACIAEFGTLPGTHNFLREWADDCSFSSWAIAWGAEEARHSLLLARYLRAIGVEVMTKHAMYKRAPYPMGESRAGTLMMNMISESRASEYYRCLALAVDEPVLRSVLGLLSRDESRHASAFFTFCRELCDQDAGHLVAALEMAYVWLADRARGIKHPSGEFYPHSPSRKGFLRVERHLTRVRATVTDDADNRVLAMIRKLTGDGAIRTPRDIKAWLRAQL